MESKLTNKQKRFIDEYTIDFNGAQAAIRSGYSENSAKEIATENLTKPHIAEAIEKKKKELAQQNLITKTEIIENLIAIAQQEKTRPSDQIRAFEVISKMLGYNEAEKREINIKEQPLFSPIQATKEKN